MQYNNIGSFKFLWAAENVLGQPEECFSSRTSGVVAHVIKYIIRLETWFLSTSHLKSTERYSQCGVFGDSWVSSVCSVSDTPLTARDIF